ncbi:MAG TPA: DUF192 domain-containing protein [Steroidobacteraceae bacterium]
MTHARTLAPLVALIGAVLLPAAATHAVDARHALPLSSFPQESIAVETRSARRHVFKAWRAETPQQREQGLMFVPSMGADEAMIFVYEPEQYVAMWMKNTILSLDMLFVDGHGCVVSVKQHAKPQSLDTIAADRPVSLVVELKAGTIASHGIRKGDRVVRPAAQWPSPADTPCATSG